MTGSLHSSGDDLFAKQCGEIRNVQRLTENCELVSGQRAHCIAAAHAKALLQWLGSRMDVLPIRHSVANGFGDFVRVVSWF